MATNYEGTQCNPHGPLVRLRSHGRPPICSSHVTCFLTILSSITAVKAMLVDMWQRVSICPMEELPLICYVTIFGIHEPFLYLVAVPETWILDPLNLPINKEKYSVGAKSPWQDTARRTRPRFVKSRNYSKQRVQCQVAAFSIQQPFQISCFTNKALRRMLI